MKKYTLILIAIMSGSAFAAETKITSNELGTISSISWADGTVQVSSPSASGGTTYTADNVTLQLVGTEFSAKSASVTLQGNTFNGNSQLVQTTSEGKLPAIDGSLLTNVASIQSADGTSLLLTNDVYSANPASVTLQGNAFNGNNQLVRLESDGKLPAIDGSQLTGITGGSQTADEVSLTLVGGVYSAKASSVTLQGNAFNGNSQLVKLESDGKLPAIDGSQLTNLPASSAVVPPYILFSRGLLAGTATDAAKNSQCSTDLGSSWIAATDTEISFLAQGFMFFSGTGTGAMYWVTRGCANDTRMAAPSTSLFGPGNLYEETSGGNARAVGCMRSDSPVRFSTTTVAYNATDAAKDTICVNEFGASYQGADVKELAMYGMVIPISRASSTCLYTSAARMYNTVNSALGSWDIPNGALATSVGQLFSTGGTYRMACRRKTN